MAAISFIRVFFLTGYKAIIFPVFINIWFAFLKKD